MSMDEIIDWVGRFDGVLTLRPAPGDGTPEASWGDTFFYYAPDGAVPANAQPFATIVTRDQPGDEASRLDRPGAFRVNMAAGRAAFVRWTGRAPREAASVEVDHGVADTVLPHPVYGAAGWLAVVNPGARAGAATRELLRAAHANARARHERRAGAP
ncbi:hypothetical protein FH609_011125 [Streptomyces sp. 3MP-14]|uniref:DUF6194 domain-containing protein n=1 Tax=Streptomyces mimosae TaxID=2586635 RepID=A0A5N6ADR2_9ACTN|nr:MULTISPECIES: DUF6194 family protein [Streptomyces]KAB8166957.1 hypothetical protein FH607_008575 [Streptomyces mimosae]KAB8176898.1 hypothetical protein FH609_011125 [Streptomyces sp. 3MP-14]